MFIVSGKGDCWGGLIYLRFYALHNIGAGSLNRESTADAMSAADTTANSIAAKKTCFFKLFSRITKGISRESLDGLND